MATVVLVSNDLLLQSQVSSKAIASGVELFVASPATFDAVLQATCPAAIAVDLASVGDIAEVVARIRAAASDECQVWAFGPHVQVSRLSAAREAGCDWVTSRGDFLQKAPARFAKLA